MAKTRISEIDGLRGIAALAIFVHHVGFQSGVTFEGAIGRYIGRADIGVPIFFVLSGFLLFSPIAAALIDDHKLRPTRQYLWRRFLRIYPAFWIALGAVLLFSKESLGLASGITTTLLMHIHWPVHALAPIPQAWSLATEVSFYVSLPLVALAAKPLLTTLNRCQRRNALFAFATLCYLGAVLFRFVVLQLDSRLSEAAVLWLPAMLDYFAIGMALAIARVGFGQSTAAKRLLDRLAKPILLWWLAGGLAFHVVSQHLGLALGLEVASWPREIGRQFIYGLIGFALLFPLVYGDGRGNGRAKNFLAKGPLFWLGKISYSFYLWHMFFIVYPLAPMEGVFGEVRPFDGDFWRLAIVAIIPTLVASTLSYLLIERQLPRLHDLVNRPSQTT